MTKHLIGFGLFVSIVGFFVIAYAVLTLPTMPSLKPEISPLAKLPTHCDFGPSKPLNQSRVIADRSAGTITLYLNELPETAEIDPNEIYASFKFYGVSGNQIRLFEVVHDSIARSVRQDAGPKWILQYNAPWVRGLARDETLYVVPGVRISSEPRSPASSFSVEDAMPVLIRN